MPRAASSPLARVRRVCLSLPETTERESHGAPSFFIRDRVCFVNYMDSHHEDGRVALWCASPSGMRDRLVKAQPDQYFVPPYVGFRGWIGVRLDREPNWDDIERVVRDAYVTAAPKKLAAAVEGP
jgi:hypothetical protein